ncbi:BTB/POZ domain-containing protein At3g19850-like [Papaver somniferum]|nr:BTB/POZ domain-containing protein At3g19850-like [Papaver somniferum]
MQEMLKIHVNGEHTFFINQKIITTYSGQIKKMMIKQTKINNSVIRIDNFPGGVNGFELISRFCHNHGKFPITPSNISVLHCSAIYLEMNDQISPYNLLQQTETFLEGLFYWSWSDILISLKSCEPFFSSAESSGILEKLISSLLVKLSQNSDINVTHSSSPSSAYSSPDTVTTGFRFSSSSKTTPDNSVIKPASYSGNSSTSKPWWFEELTVLSSNIVEKIIKTMGFWRRDNNNLVITKFLLHYLKAAKNGNGVSGIAETVVYGVVLLGRKAFSCRGVFWVLRVVSGLGLSKNCRDELERLIGGMLEEAKLDDLLVPGSNNNSGGRDVYDVDLVLRLIRVFVIDDEVTIQKMKRVGKLIDKYMGEISPDQNLKVAKFLAVAESLPDCARDCFDGVYRAIEIYLEAHPTLSVEEKSRLCECLNYEKLTLEACKDLAKNIRVPPRVSIQALISQQASKVSIKTTLQDNLIQSETQMMILCPKKQASDNERFRESTLEKDELKLNLQRMQWRVMELEKSCREMKNQMSEIKMKNQVIISSPVRTLTKLF